MEPEFSAYTKYHRALREKRKLSTAVLVVQLEVVSNFPIDKTSLSRYEKVTRRVPPEYFDALEHLFGIEEVKRLRELLCEALDNLNRRKYKL